MPAALRRPQKNTYWEKKKSNFVIATSPAEGGLENIHKRTPVIIDKNNLSVIEERPSIEERSRDESYEYNNL